MSQVLRTQLEQGVQALKLELAPAQIDLLMSFMALLQKWNKVYNLTSVRDPQEMLTHHLLDSLAAVPALLRHVAAGAGRASACRCWTWAPAVACPVWCLPSAARRSM
jgi:hypothetical protein